MSQPFLFFPLIIFLFSALLIIAIPFFFLKLKNSSPVTNRKYIFGQFSPVITKIFELVEGLSTTISGIKKFPEKIPNIIFKLLKSTTFEILVLVIWALFVGREYANFNPYIIPEGREYSMSIQMNYIWKNLFECGTCIFWNGNVRGGAPAFSDVYGNALHPLVIITTLVWGVINGSKLNLLVSLLTAGIALWWIGKILRLGKISRMWMGLIATCGGYIASRMELGTMNLVISTAACTLVLAPTLGLLLTRQKRYAILLGLTLGFALLSGQGYMQIGLFLCIFFPVFIFLFPRNDQSRVLINHLIIAGILAVLLAGVFVVPMAHIYPQFVKESLPNFDTVQTIGYLPLNLVIHSREFYYSESLEKLPFPYISGNYIGWTTILLAFYTIRLVNRKNYRFYMYLTTCLIMTILVGSGVLLNWISAIFPNVLCIRYPQLIAGYLGPLLIILAGISIDHILKIKVPIIKVYWDEKDHASHTMILPALTIMLVPVLLINLIFVHRFSTEWLRSDPVDMGMYEDTEALQTSSTQWVNIPFGDHWWTVPAMESGLKVSNATRPWDLKDRSFPPALLDLYYHQDGVIDQSIIGSINDMDIREFPSAEYAQIAVSDTFLVVCSGFTTGGDIDVRCPSTVGGSLTVFENSMDGWHAWVDGQPVNLLPGQWLSVDLGPGPHTITFRYQPWDVWVGMALSLIGILLSIWLWCSSPPLSSTQSLSEMDSSVTVNPL
jgi:hypothetical protein